MNEDEKLGILLTTSPEHANTNTVIKLTEAALKKGVEVRIFLMCDGVLHVNEISFLKLIDMGAQICLCQQNLNERFQDEANGVKLGSQYDFACNVRDVNRLLAFC
ncbi:MAG: DsrE family protein [Candidatus Hydrogenedentota bacterium]|nr:MAG: DsrE family protein [Candidatus Hydrogenedentota bacterium]